MTGLTYFGASTAFCVYSFRRRWCRPVPWIIKAVTGAFASCSAFWLGYGLGILSAIKAALIEGKLLLRLLPIGLVVDTVSNPVLAIKASESLAVAIKKTILEPSFVPQLLLPIWKFALNLALPLSRLMQVPALVADKLKSSPSTSVGSAVEFVMLKLVADSITGTRNKYRNIGVCGITGILGVTIFGMHTIWGCSVTSSDTDDHEKK